DPDEAKVVRRIYRRYLEGASLGIIQKELTEDGIPTAKDMKGWSRQILKNILTNEKYMGDVKLQKTFVTDCISKQVKKNNGERTMYYVENHHAPIVTREIFHRVQEEMARRTSKRKVMQKTGKTEQGKYSAKYALSELLVCGECGTPYKRCTWVRKGKKRIVWRCISRLEYGTKYCHNSPTLDEEKIQQAVMAALSQFAGNQSEIIESALELADIAKKQGEAGGNSLLELKRRLEILTEEQTALLEQVLQDMDNPELNAQLKALASEKQDILRQMDAVREQAVRQANQESRMMELREWLSKETAEFTVYDDNITRRLVERVTVADAETLRVKIRDVDLELERKMT
ncbi:MAG: recombinase family protein, partial [Abditibacteriota bacterium]|nr:recombinase family protein [Abditibacteriota bacterium]